MNQPIDPDGLAKGLHAAVMTMRILVGALAAGALVFLCIVTFVIEQPGDLGLPELTDPLTWIPVGAAALALPASFMIPPLITRGMRAKLAAGQLILPLPPGSPLAAMGDAGKLAMVYQTGLIVGGAILEGAAFVCGISVMVFDSGLLGLGCGLLMIALILLRFPSAKGLATWIAEQLNEIELEKTLTARNPLVER